MKPVLCCIIRRKDVIQTPEEEVRQSLLAYLLELGYSRANIAVERELTLGEKKGRVDVLIFKQGIPYVLCECKAPNINFNFSALYSQMAGYYSSMPAEYLLWTNGNQTYVWRFDKENKIFVNHENFPLP